MTPEEALKTITAVLQHISLPMVAPNGQMSHAVIGQCINTLCNALKETQGDGNPSD